MVQAEAPQGGPAGEVLEIVVQEPGSVRKELLDLRQRPDGGEDRAVQRRLLRAQADAPQRLAIPAEHPVVVQREECVRADMEFLDGAVLRPLELDAFGLQRRNIRRRFGGGAIQPRRRRRQDGEAADSNEIPAVGADSFGHSRGLLVYRQTESRTR